MERFQSGISCNGSVARWFEGPHGVRSLRHTVTPYNRRKRVTDAIRFLFDNSGGYILLFGLGMNRQTEVRANRTRSRRCKRLQCPIRWPFSASAEEKAGRRLDAVSQKTCRFPKVDLLRDKGAAPAFPAVFRSRCLSFDPSGDFDAPGDPEHRKTQARFLFPRTREESSEQRCTFLVVPPRGLAFYWPPPEP